ncbi:MAG: chlorite dismutase family protein [Opitutaceae bacterium]
MQSRLFTFAGGHAGPWHVISTMTVAGPPLPPVARLAIFSDAEALPRESPAWMLRGITSNERYVTRPEKADLTARQPSLGRPEAVCAALIPIKKKSEWWALPQDERRKIFEEQSRHIATGLQFLPAIARRLHHCRDLSPAEPFDFITWFEFAVSDTAAFDDLVARLRSSPEWDYVEREVDLRVERVLTS